MAQDPSMSADTDADPSEAGDQDDSQGGGYCIEIHVAADGSITVDVEPEAEEASEEQGEDGGESGGEGAEPKGAPAKNIKDALTMALEIFRNQGQQPGAADDSFQQGFSSSSGD